MRQFLVMGALAGVLTGCAERHVIRPAQLAIFNDEEKVRGAGIEAQKVLRLQLANGRLVEVDPPVVVFITTDDGQEHEFCSPLRADFEGGAIAINHACGGPKRIQGTEIVKVEVEEW